MNTWERILKQAEPHINPHAYTAWFYPTKLISEDGTKLVVSVRSHAHAKKLRTTYGVTITCVMRQLAMFYEIEYVVQEEALRLTFKGKLLINIYLLLR